MKRLAVAVPVCVILGRGVARKVTAWPYWWSVLSVARSLWQPPIQPEQEADYLA